MSSTWFYYDSPIGIIRICENDHLIQSISFTEEISSPEQPEPSPLIRSCSDQLDAYFKGTLKVFDLPLAQYGTHFQQQVWKQLQQIPYGATISYLTLSIQLENPKAIRAVGHANGKNPFAIVVPCHRVIGSHGEMTGYGGQIWRKKWLLDHEARYGKGIMTLFDINSLFNH